MVGFLVFCCNPQGSNAHKLKLIAVNHIVTEISVDDVDGDEKGLWMELVLEVDINEPIEEDNSHVFSNVGLAFKVVEVLGWLTDRADEEL